MRVSSRLSGSSDSPSIEGGALVAGEAEEREIREKFDKLTVERYGSVSLDNTKKLFMSYDADGDGKISKPELKEMLSDAGIGNWVTRGYWVDGIFDELDSDRDGKLTWEEYLVARSKKGTGVTPPAVDPNTGKTVDPQLDGKVPSTWTDSASSSGGAKTVGIAAAVLALFFFL